jgi:hypothetical protein
MGKEMRMTHLAAIAAALEVHARIASPPLSRADVVGILAWAGVPARDAECVIEMGLALGVLVAMGGALKLPRS